MPALEYPDESEILSWGTDVEGNFVGPTEGGVRDGSSPNETLEVDSSSATRRFKVDWAYRFDFAKYMVGYAQLYDDSGTTRLSRLLPRTHPDMPEWACTKITRITGHRFREWDAVNEVNVYHEAWVEVLYEHVPYTLAEDDEIDDFEMNRYLTYPENVEASSDYLTLPGATLTYVADPGGPHAGSAIDTKRIPFNVGKIIPEEAFTTIWHRLPDDAYQPGSAVYDRLYGLIEGDGVPYLGTINTEELFGRPSGTLLLENVVPRRRKSPLGTGFEWDLQFNWKYRPSGWNWAYGMEGTNPAAEHNDFYMASATGTFNTADTVPDFDSIYNARDLTDVFNVDAP
jgi:hypothetical protein